MARPGTWPKGTSGNPGGLPKGLAQVVALARAETVANIQALCRIRDDRNSPPAAVVAASIALLDRGWGKPTQPVAGDADHSPIHYCFEWASATTALPEPQSDADDANNELADKVSISWAHSC